MPTAVEYAAFAPPMPKPRSIANQNPQNVMHQPLDNLEVSRELDKASPKYDDRPAGLDASSPKLYDSPGDDLANSSAPLSEGSVDIRA